MLRTELAPDKINLASLGNQVPHLHWHVIPRFTDDAHFPDPVWAGRQRAGVPHPVDEQRLIEARRWVRMQAHERRSAEECRVVCDQRRIRAERVEAQIGG